MSDNGIFVHTSTKQSENLCCSEHEEILRTQYGGNIDEHQKKEFSQWFMNKVLCVNELCL